MLSDKDFERFYKKLSILMENPKNYKQSCNNFFYFKEFCLYMSSYKIQICDTNDISYKLAILDKEQSNKINKLVNSILEFPKQKIKDKFLEFIRK